MVIRSGINTLSQPIQWDTGAAFTAAAYEVGRDADATNQLHLNVPSSASFEFSINDTARLVYSAGAFAFQEQTVISTTTGILRLSPADDLFVATGRTLGDLGAITGNGSNGLTIHSQYTASDPNAQRIIVETIDTTGDAFVTVAYAEPTGTETTPFWAMRGDITTPVAGTLDASFLTFRWNPSDDSVTVFVNDGGTIRSVSIGTVT